MSLHIDINYINQLNGRVRNFKKKNNRLFQFSCCLCGDSKTNKIKARAFIFEKKNKMVFHCHNCQVHKSFKNFLKDFDISMFKNYCRDKFTDRDVPVRKKSVMEKTKKKFSMSAPAFSSNLMDTLPTIESLPKNHKARIYIESRGIYKKHFSYIHYAEKFQEWTNTLIPDKFDEKSLLYDAPRIVLPFYSKYHKLIGFQGRSLEPNDSMRYITIKLIDNEEMIFGLERIDFDKIVYVVEGPFDSLFIDNCVAGACASLPKFDDCVLIYDNERRNKEICKQMSKSIDLGNSIFIWPRNIKEKDINDLYLSLQNNEFENFIKELLTDNTFKGLMAKTKLSQWRK